MRKTIISFLAAVTVLAGLAPAGPVAAASRGSYGPWSVTTLSRNENGWNIESFKVSGGIVAWTEVNDGLTMRRLYVNDGLNTVLLAEMPTPVWPNNSFYDQVKGNYDVADGVVVWVNSDGNDREIYKYENGTTTQVSNNTYDDAHPITSQGRIAWTSFPPGGQYNLMESDPTGIHKLDSWQVLNYAFSGKNLYWINKLPGENWFRVFVNNGTATTAIGKADDRPIKDYFTTDGTGDAAWEYSTKNWAYDKREIFTSTNGAQAVRQIQIDVPPNITHIEDVGPNRVLVSVKDLLTSKVNDVQLLDVYGGVASTVFSSPGTIKARIYDDGVVRHVVAENGSPLIVRHDNDGLEEWITLDRVSHDMFAANGPVVAGGILEGGVLLYMDRQPQVIPTDGIVSAIDTHGGTVAWTVKNADGVTALEKAEPGIMVGTASGAKRVSGRLVKIADSPAVYLAGNDGNRYVFQDQGPFFSWYKDFSSVATVSPVQLASMPLSGSVLYKPGSALLMTSGSPRVYAIAGDGTLRWVTDPQVLVQRYGNDWQSMVRTIPDAFVTSYAYGPPVSNLTSYDVALASTSAN